MVEPPVQCAGVRIAFATTTAEVLGDADADRGLHEEVYVRAGVALDHCVWWDPSVEWGRYDLVIIRSPWDYVPRLGEYRQRLGAMDQLGTLRNPAAAVEWNIDKRYLLEPGSAGVPVIPTRMATSEQDLMATLEPMAGQMVIKPVSSAGRVDNGRFHAGDPEATRLARAILAGGTPLMVQPAVPSVATDGEVRAVLFGGEISHAFRKGPILALGGGFQRQGYEERVEPGALSVEQERVVTEAHRAVAQIAADRSGVTGPLLYARIDVVRAADGRDVVLEVELNEPSFFLPVDAAAADRFVAAILRQAGE